MADNEIMTLGAGKSRRILFIMSDGGPLHIPAGSAGDTGIFTGKDFRRDISLLENASVELTALVLPGTDASLDLRVALCGEGASCRLYGLYLCPGSEDVRINVELDHKVPHCTSDQLFKGIVSGTAKAGFYGRIIVDQGAFKTEAYQANHSLLLSDSARVETLPQLEIYADDVKCSHGATIGKLNAEEQFYMRSRGIPEKEAKVLQMLSFLSPVLERFPGGEARDRVSAYLEDVIRLHF